MGNTVHAFDYLEDPSKFADANLYVIFGDDRFLQLLVRKRLLKEIGGDDAEFNTSVYEGDSVAPVDIQDDLFTVSLFDSACGRLVLIDDADAFIKKYRDEVESICDRDFQSGRLIVAVNSWPSNTRLYKLIDKRGCQINCGDPQIKRGRSKSVDTKRICKWLASRAKQEYGFNLTENLAKQLLEIVEWNLGRADQELNKISLFPQSSEKLTASDVENIVGGWRAQSVWQAVEDAVQGETASAIGHISRLLQAGEHPLALYGQLSWSLRRYGKVWEISSRQSRAGRRSDLSVALREAGFRTWGDELHKAEMGVKQLGRQRVKEIYHQLLQLDLALKGTHSDERRARLAIEMLFGSFAKKPSQTHTSPKR